MNKSYAALTRHPRMDGHVRAEIIVIIVYQEECITALDKRGCWNVDTRNECSFTSCDGVSVCKRNINCQVRIIVQDVMGKKGANSALECVRGEAKTI
jgi:hypothetical protein